MTDQGRVMHVTTIDMSLALLLGAQLRAMLAAGYEVFGASAPGPYIEQLESWGIQHVPIAHATRSVGPVDDLRSAMEMWQAYKRIRPDIVHTHFIKPGTFGRPAAWLARVPVVVNTAHGIYATAESRPALRVLVHGIERTASHCSSAELVQNPYDLDVLANIGVPRSKLQVLGNGIDLHRFSAAAVDPGKVSAARAEMGAKDGDVVAGVVGRLVREKGYREIFAAARVLRVRHPEVRIVVVGPDEPDKHDAITAAEIADAEQDGVQFLGMRDDLEVLYAAFDLVVLASYREGFSRSGMEAAAMGLPIVATDIRGMRPVVDDGSTGVFVPVGDVQALVEAVARLARDPELRAAMGDRARDKALREFDERTVIKITLALYERLLAAQRPA
jgi:glycosyltransferase involved in cell wall biosynthesis